MKIAGLILAAVAAMVLLTMVLAGHSQANGGTVWCKNVGPGSQYESNSERYSLAYAPAGTTFAQECASYNTGSQTWVPSSAP